MTVYHRLDRSTDVAATYQRCRAALVAVRGLTPSAATQGLLKTFSGR